ncbi:MAG: cyclopropane-fatty-acyl-phospholipid synthase family protein [Dehalococcoidia bacterium]
MSILDAAAAALARRLLPRVLSQLDSGLITIVFTDGYRLTAGMPSSGRGATLRVLDNKFFRKVLADGEIGFAEAYMDGLFETDDLLSLLAVGLEGRTRVGGGLRWLSAISRLSNRRFHRHNRNTVERARNNMHAHYDLSNELFELFLDDTLSYSCAIFESNDESLEDAQANKYRILSEKAELSPGQRILEIGGGWGGYAIYAAGHYGVHVTMVNISADQVELARQRVADTGLDDLVEIQLRDYREIEGQFDKVVVMGMIEQVGAEYYEEFFKVCDRALKPGGLFVLQTITVPDRAFVDLRDGVNFMQKYIFPGGMLPSLQAIREAAAPTALEIQNTEEIGQHYVGTMHIWRERFLANLDKVRALGFDERFIRMWDYYLAASEACFLTKTTGDLQIVFRKTA